MIVLWFVLGYGLGDQARKWVLDIHLHWGCGCIVHQIRYHNSPCEVPHPMIILDEIYSWYSKEIHK